ncbi:MAG: response regulator [Desulfobacterales bacterium]|nr:response regulator [Desulfobacterales bacterium]
MLKMNGLKLSEAMLKIKPDLPIIICSGFSEQLTKENIKQTGVSYDYETSDHCRNSGCYKGSS